MQEGWELTVTTYEGVTEKDGGVLLVSKKQGKELLDTLKAKAPTVLLASEALNEQAQEVVVLVEDKHGNTRERKRFAHKLGAVSSRTEYKPKAAKKTVPEYTLRVVLTVSKTRCSKERRN